MAVCEQAHKSTDVFRGRIPLPKNVLPRPATLRFPNFK